MTTYGFGFYGFGALSVSTAAGHVLPSSSVEMSRVSGAEDVRLALAEGCPVLTGLLVEDVDGALSGGSEVGSAGQVRVAAGSGFGAEGQPVTLRRRIKVTACGDASEELIFHVLCVDGIASGLVGPVPLTPGLSYAIRHAEDVGAAVSLRQQALSVVSADRTARAGPDLSQATFGMASDTLVDTPDGTRRIDSLQVGDLVTTVGNGSQPLRWIGRKAVTLTEVLRSPELQPVEFAPGAIGSNDRLLLSPHHRILLNDWRAQVYFGEDEVLVPAAAMVNGKTVRQVLPARGLTYIQLLFDRHEILVSDGALSESFHPDEAGLMTLDTVQRREVELLFPGLDLQRRRAALPIVRLSEARALQLPG